MSSGKDHPRSSIQWKKLRKAILIRDQFTCFYCGNEATHVDHVIPMKEEPALFWDETNLVAACRRCNLAKGSRSSSLFLSTVSTPPVLANHLSPRTTGTVQAGPMQGQPRPLQP